MKKTYIALAAAALILAAPMVSSAEDIQPNITVSGTGTISAPADTASIYVIVETSSPDAAQAASDNAAISQKVWDAAMAAGAADQGITTTSYNLYPETNQQKKSTVYRVQNSMKVTVRDLKKTGAVTDAALKAGATRIGQVQFTLENAEPYKARAIQAAVQDAKSKADAIAAGLGCTITGVRSVSVGDVRTSAPQPQYRMLNASLAAGGDNATNLTPGDQDITGNVTIVYEIN